MLCAGCSWPTQTVLHQLQEESDGVPFIGRGRVAGGEQELLGTLCHPFGCWVRRYLNILPGKGWRRLGLCVLGREHQSCSWLCPRHSRHRAAMTLSGMAERSYTTRLATQALQCSQDIQPKGQKECQCHSAKEPVCMGDASFVIVCQSYFLLVCKNDGCNACTYLASFVLLKGSSMTTKNLEGCDATMLRPSATAWPPKPQYRRVAPLGRATQRQVQYRLFP